MMRLREMQHILKANLPALELGKKAGIPGGLEGWPELSNTRVVAALYELQRVPGLRKMVGTLMSRFGNALVAPTKGVAFSSKLANEFEGQMHTLSRQGALLFAAISETLPEERDTELAILLPRALSPGDLVEIMKDVALVFNPAMLKEHVPESDVRIQGFDTGSEFIIINVGAIGAVLLILRLLKGVKLNLAFKAQLTTSVANLDLQGEVKVQVEAKNDERVKQHKQEQITAAAQKSGVEELKRLSDAFAAFTRLVENGAEVFPALGSGDAVKKEAEEIAKLPSGSSTEQRQLREQNPQHDEHVTEAVDANGEGGDTDPDPNE